MQFYKEKIKRLSEELKIKEEERNKKDAKNEDLEQEIDSIKWSIISATELSHYYHEN